MTDTVCASLRISPCHLEFRRARASVGIRASNVSRTTIGSFLTLSPSRYRCGSISCSLPPVAPLQASGQLLSTPATFSLSPTFPSPPKYPPMRRSLLAVLSIWSSSHAFTTTAPSRISLSLNAQKTNSDKNQDNDEDWIVSSREPQKVERGTFLGFRSITKEEKAQMRKTTALQSSPTNIMPDGGLSPCVIRVLGVGGGGCNAVRYEESLYIYIHTHTSFI